MAYGVLFDRIDAALRTREAFEAAANRPRAARDVDKEHRCLLDR